MELSSPAFENGEPIPDRHGYTAANVNPPLRWSGVPDEAESLALVVDDPDAVEPAGKVWDHWVVWNIDPDRREIPVDWDAEDAVVGQNDYGEPGYGGPNPPDGTHTYEFRLYALDDRLTLSPGATKAQLEETMSGHTIDRAELMGTFSP